ncbi:primosomal protein N' [Utexia brackfieldae]|uniref:primosomal protein N' n=1 Tax=Utexia brackfieldae TaxID=3074108 RepID=UPI00370D67F6
MPIAHVALALPLYQLFDYQIPTALIGQVTIGGRVTVPFGNRHSIGIVVAIDEQTEFQPAKLKTVVSVIDQTSLFSDTLWQLLIWATDYYHYPLGEVLSHALPALLRQGRPAELPEKKQWQLTEIGATFALKQLSRAPQQQKLLALFQQQQPAEIIQSQDFSANIYQQLKQKQLIVQVVLPQTIHRWQPSQACNPSPLTLNTEQQQALTNILPTLNTFHIWLLDGVTGSGKTEIYLNALASVLSKGQQALMLVPEIGLTPQTIARFQSRFNAPIDILHSGLNDTERLQVYLRAKQGENAIVIGTRSALFTPFQSLGLIIIDEEHDSSYKQQEGWRYHARDLAIVRAQREQVPVILGSATPALESLHNAEIGKYQYVKLTQRAGGAHFARQEIIDIKGLPLNSGLSQPLIQKINAHLAQNKQVLLFLNRRGFAPLLVCHDCGWIAECPRCDKPFTYHEKQHKLICHHCDTPRNIPSQCPKCGSTHLQSVGVGTEQLEKQLRLRFPDIPVSRIDRDSTAKKGALEGYIEQINQGQAHILVGTQILAKGHHFPNVTLVGILDVDGALFSSDFRATEHFAQLYTQVSGRAGRGEQAGEVLLQTYHPQHPLLNLLLEQGYPAFAQQTLHERAATLLPPYSYQILIRAADKNNQHAPALLERVYQWLRSECDDPALWLLGPVTATQSKKAGLFRWQLLLQHPHRRFLQTITTQLIAQMIQWPETKNTRWTVDVDPIDF